MPLGTLAMLGVVLPVERTNLLTNPSFERGTSGWGTIQAGTIGTTANFQTFGAWAGSMAVTSNGTSGCVSPTWTAGSGSDYTISAYVKGQAGVPYRMAVGDSSGLNFVGSTTFTGGGTWQRYSFSYTESVGATRTFVLTKNSSGNAGAIYLDGVQAEVGSLTTYLDGDQEGCLWNGAPHNATSIRSGQSRAGGSVVALADLGLTPIEEVGLGMPPLETTAQSFALAPGAEFQRQRAGIRPFTVTAQMAGTTWRDFHNTRRTVINALKIDSVSEQQPIRFWYVGGEGTVQIDAVLEGGLDGGNRSGFTEAVGVRFLAHDPYWKNTTDEGTSLAARVSLGTTNYLAMRDPQGRWGTLGNAGTTTDAAINVVQVGTDNTLYFGGAFTTVGGTTYPRLGQYNRTTNTFGTLVGGTVNAVVKALSINSQGSIFIGGPFSLIGGTTAGYIGFWASNFGTLGSLSGGPAAYGVNTMAWNWGGTLFVGGDFKLANGTTSPFLSRYANGAWGSMLGQSGGTVNGNVYGLTVGLDNTLYFGGNANAAGGTAAGDVGTVGVMTWRNAFGTINQGLDTTIEDLATMPDGRIAVAGQFLIAGPGSVFGITMWTGGGYQALGSGVQVATNVFRLFPFADGRLLAVGNFTQSGSIQFLDQMGIWNGYTWLPLDVDFQTTTIVNDATFASDGTMYLCGDFTGTARAASVVPVVNTGGADVYPTLRARLNATSGTAHVYQLVNMTTGDGIYFNNLSVQPGEEVTLALQPGARSFRSSFGGNIFGQILPGSNLATFRLLPGTNYISFFADNDSLVTSIAYRPRSWSADGTTAY